MSRYHAGDLVLVKSPSYLDKMAEISGYFYSGVNGNYYAIKGPDGKELDFLVREDKLELVFSV